MGKSKTTEVLLAGGKKQLFIFISIGARRLYLAGGLWSALSGGLIFGTLEYVKDTTTFLALSYLLRFNCDFQTYRGVGA